MLHSSSAMPGSDLEGYVVTETLLTRKPARGSLPLAAASVAALFLGSLLYWTNAFDLGPYLPASRGAVFERSEYFRLFTSVLVHADFEHFAGNALGFGLLAFLLHGYFGASAYPGLALANGVLTTALSLTTYDRETLLLGASGVVYWMAGFWLSLYLLLERRFPIGKRMVRAFGFAIVVLIPTVLEREVSYRTHAIGFGLGVAVGLFYFAARKSSLRQAERLELE